MDWWIARLIDMHQFQVQFISFLVYKVLIKLTKMFLSCLAPEKVVGESVGVAADIWGVGVLAFIL